MKIFTIVILFVIKGTLANQLLRSEVERSVDLIELSQNVSEILNTRTVCSNVITEEKQEGIDKSEYCFQKNAENEIVENTSLFDLRDIRDQEFNRVCPKATCTSTDFGSTGGRWSETDGTRNSRDFYDRMTGSARDGSLGRNPARNHIRPERYMDNLIPSYQLAYSDPKIGPELKEVHDSLRSTINGCPLKDENRYVAATLLAQASESAGMGNYEEAREFLNLSKALADFTKGDHSQIDTVRSIYEFLTGKDFDTGADLSGVDNIAAAGVGGLWRVLITGGARAISALGRLGSKYFGKVWRRLGEAGSRATKLGRNIRAGKWKDVFQDAKPASFLRNDSSKKVLEKFRRDKKIPKNWDLDRSNKNDGIKFIKPGTKRTTNIRIQQGDPGSRYPNSREPYVRIDRNGNAQDINGNTVPKDSNAAHIPLRLFRQFPDWLKNQGEIDDDI